MKDEQMIDLLINGKIDASSILDQLEICAFRSKIYNILHNKDTLLAYAQLIRCLLSIEITKWGKVYDDDATYDYEAFYWCIFLLSRVKNVADIKFLWKAKNLDFDTHCGVDIQFLVGAGVDHTISYLKEEKDEISKEILEYILRCKQSGDFDYLDEWYQYRYAYFIANEDDPEAKTDNQ